MYKCVFIIVHTDIHVHVCMPCSCIPIIFRYDCMGAVFVERGIHKVTMMQSLVSCHVVCVQASVCLKFAILVSVAQLTDFMKRQMAKDPLLSILIA